MTKNAKILLGCGSALLIGAVIVVIALVGFVYYIGSNPNYEKAQNEGKEWGKGVDQTACMTEGFKRSRSIGILDIGDSVANGAFVESCLDNATPVADFCKGVPGIFGSASEWHQSECSKAGLDATASGCIGVTKARHRFCN